MFSNEPVVFVIDGNDDVRCGMDRLFRARGMVSRSFASPREFLDAVDPQIPGCLVCDIVPPGTEGLELQALLQQQGVRLPIIFVSENADLSLAVLTMKRGAVDFIAKPVSEEVLLESVAEALARDRLERERREAHRLAETRLACLTDRERDVLHLLLQGKSNKLIATELGLSHKTVEFHRSRIMIKSRTDSLADLVRLSVLANACEATVLPPSRDRQRALHNATPTRPLAALHQ